jgi:hypothetical protein
MRALVIASMLAGCGRINFDPLGEGGGSGTDARGIDTPTGDGETCMAARTIAIGDTFENQSIAGALDDHTLICPGGVDVVYQFTQPAAGTRQLQVLADFDGAAWVNTSGSACPPINGTCSLFVANLATNMMPNVSAGTRTIVIEKTGGAGTTFSISLQ